MFLNGANVRPTQTTRLDYGISHTSLFPLRNRVSCPIVRGDKLTCSAGILIWQGSARTKKVISVEDKLRSALGVSLAIGGIARNKDGNYVNPAPHPASSPSLHSTSGGSDEKDRELQNLGEITEESDDVRDEVEDGKRRRSTITFGTGIEKVEGRDRGSMVGVPLSGQPPALGPVVGSGDSVEMREVGKEPKAAQDKE
jgi:hypothetical protein